MKIFLFSIVVFVLAPLGMALSVLAGRAPMRGTCGGLPCELCEHKCDHTRESSS